MTMKVRKPIVNKTTSFLSVAIKKQSWKSGTINGFYLQSLAGFLCRTFY